MARILFFCFLLYRLTEWPIAAQEVEYDLESWTKAAQYLRSTMNSDVKPCSSFFEHVCGRYNDSSQGEQGYQRALLSKLAVTIRVLEEALAKVDLKKAGTPGYQRSVRSFYDRCSAQTPNSKELTKQMYDAVAGRLGPFPLFGPLPTDFNIWRTLGILQRQADTNLGYGAKVVTPLEDQGGFNATAVPVLVLESSPFSGDVNATGARKIILSLANALGKNVDDKQVDDLISRAGQLFTDLITYFMGSSPGADTSYSLSNATSTYPFLNQLLDTLLPQDVRKQWSASEKAFLRIQSEDWFKRFAAVTKNSTHKPDTWQALAFLRVIWNFEEQYYGEYDPQQAVVVMQPKSIKERCLDFVVRNMAPGAARLYFDYIGEDIGRWRSEIQLMARNVFSAFRFMLNSIKWVDEDDKVKINEKISAVKVFPGLPDWITDDKKVVEHMDVFNENQSLYENQLVSKTRKFDHSSIQLVNGSNNEDPSPTFEVNSGYETSTKTVLVYLGMILPPYYQSTYPLAVKYGGYGMVIGHELGHAFDSSGVYEPASADKEWLKQSTLDEFEKRKACLIQQYSQHCYKKLGMCVDGRATIGDNIADIDGLKAAYLAYKYVAQTVGGDVPVPQLFEYTSDQIFFMSAARQWCTRNDPTVEVLMMDVHTPDRARMEIAVRNVPQFASAFNCPTGSAAVAEKACPIWGDFNTVFTKSKKEKKTKGEETSAASKQRHML